MNIDYLKGKEEYLAEQVHNAWWEQKKAQGYHAPVNCHGAHTPRYMFKPNCLMCHPDMYPYKDLPDNVKEYDRVTVRTVLNAIEKL